jgi:NDP-sugar pyrophosphorylase family protein
MFVLAGGFGTRLRSVVSDVPKPLAPVSGKPFISYLIDHWIEQGINDLVFLLHYEAEQIKAILESMSADPSFSDVNFRTIIEEAPLGTGGSLLHAIKKLGINDSFLVANADTWLGSGVNELCRMPPCTLTAVSVPNSQRYGALQFEGTKITLFEEKSSSVGEGFVNSGLYYLSPEIFDGEEVGSSFSLEDRIFPRLVASRALSLVKVDDSFIDIGVPSDYLKFCDFIESGGRE